MSRYTEFARVLVRKFAHALLLTALLVTGTVMLFIASHDNNPQTQQAQNDSKQAWGNEALSHVYKGMSKISPIPLANACGLGASSCFKCHNGRRAPAVNMDAKKAPWHTEHEPVNYSCAGCHQGNPRLMIKSMAHSKMLSDPRSNLKLACSTCHSGDDMTVLSKPYMSLQGEK